MRASIMSLHLCDDGPAYVAEPEDGRWVVRQEKRRIRHSAPIVYEALDMLQAQMVADALNRYHKLFKAGIPQKDLPVPICSQCHAILESG